MQVYSLSGPLISKSKKQPWNPLKIHWISLIRIKLLNVNYNVIICEKYISVSISCFHSLLYSQMLKH
jgi:hypothetical protein